MSTSLCRVPLPCRSPATNVSAAAQRVTAAAAAAVAVAAAAAVIFADRSGQRPAQHHIAATNSLRWPLHLRALTP